MTTDTCLVLDLGAPQAQSYAQELARSVRKRGVHSRIESATISAARLTTLNPRAVILVGSPLGDCGPLPDELSGELARSGIPVLSYRSAAVAGSPGPHIPDVLDDFLFRTAKFSATWTMARFLDISVPRLRTRIGAGQVVLGLSGGVDSWVTAALLRRAVGDQLTCVLVDNGFLRAGEREAVEATFRELIPGRLHVVDAGPVFLAALAGAAPGRKRSIIRREFRAVFDEQAAQLPNAVFLAQGIIYSDLIGAAPALDPDSGSTAAQPPGLEPIQPLSDLFKDEVRELGALLGLPRDLLHRQPFPGPGLAVRCVGEVTQPRLDILRAADRILGEEIARADLPRTVFQSFAVLLPVAAVTATSGYTPEGETVCLRVLESEDGATATWTSLPASLLATISARLMTQVPGVSRVVYDITGKPPGRIEWE
jgi:GMP synthase (glutamine-hydrolysing)